MKQNGKSYPITSGFLVLCLCLLVQSGCSQEAGVADDATQSASDRDSSTTAEPIAPQEPAGLATQTPADTLPPETESPAVDTTRLAEEPLTVDEPGTATALIEQEVIEEELLLASEAVAAEEGALVEVATGQLQEPQLPVQNETPPPLKEDLAPALAVELDSSPVSEPETELTAIPEPELNSEAQTVVAQQAVPLQEPAHEAPPELISEQVPEPGPEPEITLDLDSMETRLRKTKAMGLFTKLEIKGQVKDLIKEMDKYHEGRSARELEDLHEQFDLLMMKLLVLLQDDDPDLHLDIALARPTLWTTLSDPVQFNTVKGP